VNDIFGDPTKIIRDLKLGCEPKDEKQLFMVSLDVSTEDCVHRKNKATTNIHRKQISFNKKSFHR